MNEFMPRHRWAADGARLSLVLCECCCRVDRWVGDPGCSRLLAAAWTCPGVCLSSLRCFLAHFSSSLPVQASTPSSTSWRQPSWTRAAPAAGWRTPSHAWCPPWRRRAPQPGGLSGDVWRCDDVVVAQVRLPPVTPAVCSRPTGSRGRRRIWARRRPKWSPVCPISPSCRPKCWCSPPRWRRSARRPRQTETPPLYTDITPDPAHWLGPFL